jgi:RimJ/RimL family protein N-acetyltransferase
MRLETERLLIRRFRAEDWKDLHAYLSDAEVVRYEPYGVFSEEDAIREALRRAEDTDFWAVCLKDDRLIGNIYFAPQQAEEFRTWEIGFVFSAVIRSKGMPPKPAEGFCGLPLRSWARIASSVCATRKIQPPSG